MMQVGLIGIGAGAAAALLFASVISGSWLSILLFYLAPLPIMIAGIGWSHWAALAGALTGALALGLVFGLVFFFAFLAGAGIPAWWLSYLTMLARPAVARANGAMSGAALEWYPPGRLVVWAAVLAALVVVAAIPNFGIDVEGFRAGLHEALARMLRAQPGLATDSSLPGVDNVERFVDFLVAVIPAVAAALVHKAVGSQLTCVFVDTGLMRAGEADQVEDTFRRQFKVDLVHVKAADRYFAALAGVTDPERKRKIIGELFIRIAGVICRSLLIFWR